MAGWKRWGVVVAAVLGAACGSTNTSTGEAVAVTDEACVPVTCAQLGRFCGSTSDGCGGTVNCGTCGNGGTCNAMGYCCGATGSATDPCGAPLHAGGAVDFAVITQGLENEGFTAVDSDFLGNMFVLRLADNRTFLERYDESNISYSVDLKSRAGTLIVAPTLDRLYISTASTARSLVRDERELQFSKAGTELSSQNFVGDRARLLLGVGYNGVKAFADIDSELVVADPTDKEIFSFDELPVQFFDVAFDIDGNVYAVGKTRQAFELNSIQYGNGVPFMVKLNKGGVMQWARQINVPGSFNDVGVTANGYAVVGGTFRGGFTWGATVLESREDDSGMVLGFKPDGSEWYAYAAGLVEGFPRVSMDQSGTAFVGLDRRDCGAMEVAALNFKGELAWRKSFDNPGCTRSSRLTGIAAVRGVPAISGILTGKMNFGTGQELDPNANHGFLIKFKR